MKRTLALSAAALFLSLGVIPCVARAEGEEAPAPPERPEQIQRRGPGREGGPGAMTEEERAKLGELMKNVGDAIAAYKANPTDETKAALKTQVAASFEFRQKLMIERMEKALTQAKERLKNKDAEVDKQVERMLKPRPERPDKPERPERPDKPPRAGVSPFRGEGFGAPMRAAFADGERGPRGPMGPHRPMRAEDPMLLLLTPEAPVL